MPDLLRARKCDIVLNGYEWLPERLDVMEATIPYYVFGLQLLARDGGEIKSWDDLDGRSGQDRKRIGVLAASAAEKYLIHANLGIDIVDYDGSTDAMREVRDGKARCDLAGHSGRDASIGRGFLGFAPSARRWVTDTTSSMPATSEKELVRRLNRCASVDDQGRAPGGALSKTTTFGTTRSASSADIAHSSPFFGYDARFLDRREVMPGGATRPRERRNEIGLRRR